MFDDEDEYDEDEYDEDEYDEDDDLDEDDYEYEDDDNEDGFGDDDDNPSGYGEDPEPEDEDELKDDDGEGKGNAKKSKKNTSKNGVIEGKDIKSEGAQKGKGRTPNPTKMNRRAQMLKCGARTKKRCPFCKQLSIYPEPMVTSLVRKTIWYIAGLDRKQRYVCLNPYCKACYEPGSPRARFVEGFGGLLITSHYALTPDNPFSPRPPK